MPTITTPATTECTDNAANRAMAVVVDRLLSRVSSLAEAFQRAPPDNSNDFSLKAPRRLEVIQQSRAALKRIRLSPPFADIKRPEITAEGLNAISAHPSYAMAYKLAWKVLRSGIADAATDRAPVSPTWEIFERWCFVQTVRVLETLLPQARWTPLRNGRKLDTIRVRGVTKSIQIDVFLQARFRAWDIAAPGGFRSLSGERVPDIVVTLTSGSNRHLMVLDAKYRASRFNVLDAMQSAHLYRDSLFWCDARPWRSLLLIPRGGSAPWLEDVNFHSDYGVGCIEVRDSAAVGSLAKSLSEFVALAKTS